MYMYIYVYVYVCVLCVCVCVCVSIYKMSHLLTAMYIYLKVHPEYFQ